MTKVYLTDPKVRNLKKAEDGGRYDVMDAEVRGLGVRVNSKGERTFVFYSRFPGKSAPERRVLGEFILNEDGEQVGMSLASARDKARVWRGLIKSGIDPKVKEEEARTAEKISAVQKTNRAFEVVLDRWIKARKVRKIRKVDEDQLDLQREFLPTLHEPNKGKKGVKPVWEGRDIASITMDDIMKVLRSIADRGKKRQALNVGQKVGTFFKWCVTNELIAASPYRPGRVTDEIGKKEMRKRMLSDDEIRAFWKATDGTTKGLGSVYCAAYRLLLLTGQRLNDIAEASWSEIQQASQVLVVPAERFKSDRDHVVPLTDDAMAIIEKLPRFKKCDWMFSLDGQGPVTMGDKIKKRLDKAMLAELKEHDPEATLPHWINHDLRRTLRPRLSRLKVTPDIAEMVIGHQEEKLRRNYDPDPFSYIDEKRAALVRWEGKLREIIAGEQASNVIQMPGRAS
ncbi:site-specific integrase [Mesorhizobium sp. M2D.F.Ca.ET.232.01.1.1]|uniref:tyrosine-type recombinase/integrase n=1 Tax=Mesorhizobium sp. M2D.F.Ca.ET.232.01.1.1 TaxID=2496670 RepID=UPI000FCB668A|nr:site-specific integrase [Mesorhizobium sp. M2D.F.Ca.ET.232.01.1.1]TGP27350.1 site-specific integrase [Mesorhizobium sp. M2D.F.Ca.ET.232.01.1.1]